MTVKMTAKYGDRWVRLAMEMWDKYGGGAGD